MALSVGNRIEHLEIIFATAKIGALAIPLDVKWKALELGSVLSFFRPSVLILQLDCVDEFETAKTTQDLSFLKPIHHLGFKLWRSAERTEWRRTRCRS